MWGSISIQFKNWKTNHHYIFAFMFQKNKRKNEPKKMATIPKQGIMYLVLTDTCTPNIGRRTSTSSCCRMPTPSSSTPSPATVPLHRFSSRYSKQAVQSVVKYKMNRLVSYLSNFRFHVFVAQGFLVSRTNDKNSSTNDKNYSCQ